jgi:hypothetical protein
VRQRFAEQPVSRSQRKHAGLPQHCRRRIEASIPKRLGALHAEPVSPACAERRPRCASSSSMPMSTLGVHPSARGSNSVRSQSAVVDCLRLFSREHVRSRVAAVSLSHRPRPCSARTPCRAHVLCS